MHAIAPPTLAAISAALDAATLRQQVIATNIAHAHRSDAEAHRVRFDVAWPDAGAAASRRVDARPVALAPRIEVARDADGRPQPIRLDDEVAALSMNAVHYQALVRAIDRMLSIVASAASEGRR